MDEATVTSPPPELLYTTSPVLVATAVAPLGVVGARARLVGGGTVDAAAEALALLAVALVWRLARDRRLVAWSGFSE